MIACGEHGAHPGDPQKVLEGSRTHACGSAARASAAEESLPSLLIVPTIVTGVVDALA
jgi:hypothetical protein